jgi:hypothetical protein
LRDPCCRGCGFKIDPLNESQLICPACGTAPDHIPALEDELDISAVLEDGASFAEEPVLLTGTLEGDEPIGSDVDLVPDNELELALDEGEALIAALTEGPVLVAGNSLIN